MAKQQQTSGKKKVFKKKEKKVVPQGIVHIQATFNNTLISITDLNGNLVAQSSAGAMGFRGSRKGTPFAAQQAAMPALPGFSEELNWQEIEANSVVCAGVKG